MLFGERDLELSGSEGDKDEEVEEEESGTAAENKWSTFYIVYFPGGMHSVQSEFHLLRCSETVRQNICI